MLKSNFVSKPASTRSVNIRVIKPTGIKSVWNWFTNRNKKGNLQNIMFDKKFRLKLNIEELEALKRNGIDLQKLQIAANCEGKKRKKFVILPKDQSEMDKNLILNNSILCDLMKNKGVSKKPRKYKKSIITTSSLSIKSKNNVIDSTYIHSIKSKRSIINSGSSKASLKVGLKSPVAEDVQMNKNIIIKGIQEELLKRNMQKKVFVPIYLGKKKSSKVNKGDNDKKVENKTTNENESNVIPLLLSKLKTMEGQISGIENTTKKINEAVSQKNMINVKNPSKTKGNQVQSNTKGLPTHKMYPKRSLKKFKPNKIESKSATNSPDTSLRPNSAHNTDLPVNKTEKLKSTVTSLKSKDKMKSIKYILDDPKHFLKNHTFVIPNKLSEKSLFSANPNVGCDVMLKLFEALTESNDSHHETSTDDNQTNIYFSNTSDIDSPKPNKTDVKLEMSCTDKPKGLTSISESQLGMMSNKADSENKNYSQPKKNISCPSSSTDMAYKDNSDMQIHILDSNLVTQEDKGHLHKSQDDERNLFINETKSEQPGKKDKDTTNLPPSTSKSCIVFSQKELGVADAKFKTMISTKKFEQEQNEKIKGRNILRPQNDSSLLFEVKSEENKMNLVKKIPEFKLFESNIKNNKTDNSNFKISEYNDLKGIELQVSEGRMEKQVIKVPIPTDSKNICSICIEPTLDLNLAKPLDLKGQSEINEANFCSADEMKEPKLSITILVKNNLNDGMSSINNITSHIGSKITSSFEAKENHKWTKTQKSILTFNQEDSYNRLQGKGKNFNNNSEKYVPPLRLETFDTTPRSMASSGFVHRNSNNIDNFFNKPNLGQKTEFGFENVSYLNQEQRKKFDTQLSKSANDKLLNSQNSTNLTGKIQKNTALKPGAKSSINLKHDCPPIRHLSESSLYLKKFINGKTVNKSIKNCRKSPYESLECLKIKNKLNTTNILEDYYYNNIKLSSNQQLDITHKPLIIRSKEFNILNTRNKQISINYSDVISSKEFITVKNKTEQKKDFYIVCKKRSTDDSRNTVISNQSCRKRSNRCSMTLKKPSLNNLDREILFDKTSKVDHQARNIELISTKEITTSGEIFNNTSRIFHSPNKETASINHVGEDPTLIIQPSQPSSPTKDNHPLDSLPSSEMSKCQNNLVKAAESSASKDLNYQSGVQPELKSSTIPADSTLVALFGDEAIGVNCLCVFSKADTSISERTSESQPSIIEQLQLRPLSIDALPMACPCIIEKSKAASESWFRSHAEILMNESIPHRMDKCWQLYLICQNCLSRLGSGFAHNGDTTTLESNEDTFNKQNHEAINGTKLNSNSNFNCYSQSEPQVLKNEKTAEVFDSKSIECQSQSVTNENNFYSLLKSPVDNLLDGKLQNDTEQGDEKKEPCCSTCLTIPSDEGSCSDSSDNKIQNSFCLDAISEPDCSNEHNIAKKDVAKGIIHHLCKINGGYKVENITHSTTVFHFSDEEEFTSIKQVPNNKAMTSNGLTSIGDCSKFMKYKESNENKKYMEQKENHNSNYMYDEVNNERRSRFNVNHNYEDPYRNIAVKRSTQPSFKDQIRYKNTNLEAGDGCFTHISPAITCRSVKSNSEYNKQLEYEYLAKNNQVLLNMNAYKSFERSMLKTIQENDSEETGFGRKRDYAKYVPTQRPKVLVSSTDYVVNCLHSIEYDITSENRNSLLYRCSVNSYTSRNSKK